MRLSLFENIKYVFSFLKKGFLVTLHQGVLIETGHTLTISLKGNTQSKNGRYFPSRVLR